MQRNVLEYLEATAPRLPDKVAFSNGADALTFAQLHRAARGIGTRLAREGLDHEPVVVFMEKHPPVGGRLLRGGLFRVLLRTH